MITKRNGLLFQIWSNKKYAKLLILYLQRKYSCFLTNLVIYFFHSDNEEERGRSSHNGKSGKDFKDDEETVTTKSVHIVQATETTATRKRGVPSRKVDLGAAAQYTGDKSPGTTAKQVTHGYM